MSIFVFTASNKSARQHLEDTIEKSVDVSILQKHLTPKQFGELNKLSDNEGFYCWGATPGPNNERNWNQMEQEDSIISYWEYSYHHHARILYKVRNVQLAKELWGIDNDGNTWEFMYFLSRPISINPPLSSKETQEYLQSQFQGFTKIKKEKSERIINDYGSLENFIASYHNDVNKNSNRQNETMATTNKQIIQHAHTYITDRGFQYQYEEIANFYLALCAKPFVILAGISGTGKTQLPRKFAASLGFSKDQVLQLPVRPDWTDGSDLLGYTSLDGNFIPKDLTIAIRKAAATPDKPFFFILDEMNLARVEHYFSDFLSVIETRERVSGEIKTDPILREEVINSAKNRGDFSVIGWPQNLYLIGTVNMDETTHSFSRKVLDRANSIEMNEVDLKWINTNSSPLESLSNISNALLLTSYLTASELSDSERNSITSEMKLLQDINKILQKADLHFAYRVRDEVAFYLILNKKHDLIESRLAFDFQLVQKVLPRIHGSSERVQKILIELIFLIEKGQTENVRTDVEFQVIEKQFPIDTLKYKRASKKILFMLKRFDEDRFTSFWL